MRVRFEELSDALDVERQRNLKQSDALDLAEAARSTALRAAAIAQAKALESDPGNKLSVTEALDRADALKRQANVILADTRYPEAVEHYTIGIQVCRDSKNYPNDVRMLMSTTKGGRCDTLI